MDIYWTLFLDLDDYAQTYFWLLCKTSLLAVGVAYMFRAFATNCTLLAVLEKKPNNC